jgi:hypothetical protein
MTTKYPVDSTYYPCCRGIGNHGRDCNQVIDPATFTRLAEVDAFAKRAGCDRADAIRLLVNSALSLLCWECKLNIGGEDFGDSDPYGGMCPSCRRKAIDATKRLVSK